jgi:hypothetical protein
MPIKPVSGGLTTNGFILHAKFKLEHSNTSCFVLPSHKSEGENTTKLNTQAPRDGTLNVMLPSWGGMIPDVVVVFFYRVYNHPNFVLS